MRHLRLRPRARQDIEQIWSYSLDNFGEQRATEYIEAIRAAFKLLQQNPGLARGAARQPAQSGDGALALLQSRRFDVLLVDFRIPDLRGDALFELAASMQPHLRHQTLFMTGDITERAQQLIEACGCPFVRKPFDLADVTAGITALLPRLERISA